MRKLRILFFLGVITLVFGNLFRSSAAPAASAPPAPLDAQKPAVLKTATFASG